MPACSPDHVNLFLIGVNKAGTSWLYALLRRHPDVFMSEEKELNYFGERYPEALDAYHAHFPFEQSYRYFGEATPSYCRDAAVAHQLRTYAPDAKVLAIVRDPVDRLYSQFYYHKQLGYIDEEARPEALLRPPLESYRRNSHYEQLLPPFEEAFGPEQFKLISLETANADLNAFWKGLQTFLDVQCVPPPSSGTHSNNATGGPAFRALYRRLVHPLKLRFPSLYRALLRSPLAHAAKQSLLHLLGTSERPPLPPEVEAPLREEYQPTYRYLVEQGFSIYEPAVRSSRSTSEA